MTSAVQSLSALRLAWPRRRHMASTLLLGTVVLLYLFAGLSLSWTGLADGRAGAVPAIPGQGEATSVRASRVVPPLPEPLSFREMNPVEAAAYYGVLRL